MLFGHRACLTYSECMLTLIDMLREREAYRFRHHAEDGSTFPAVFFERWSRMLLVQRSHQRRSWLLDEKHRSESTGEQYQDVAPRGILGRPNEIEKHAAVRNYGSTFLRKVFT